MAQNVNKLMYKYSSPFLIVYKQLSQHHVIKKIAEFPRNGVTKAVFFSVRARITKLVTARTSIMAASPGNMYQKQTLKKRPTSYLQPSSGSVSKADKKDIPLNSMQPPPSPRTSPTIDRGSNISLRKFSQISLHSDASDVADLHTDANSNTRKKHTGTPKNAIRKLHHQVGT